MHLPNLDHMKLLAAIEHADQLQDALFSLGCRLHGMAMDIGKITVEKAWAVVNG